MPTPPAHAVRAVLGHRLPAALVLAAAVLVAGAAPLLVGARTAAVVAAQARSAVDRLPADGRAVRVTTNSADDPAAQLAAASTALEAVGLRGAVVHTSRFTYPLDATAAESAGGAAPGGGATRVVLASAADHAALVDVVDGREPAAADVVEVLAPHASTLATGDELLVGARATPVRVVGTWTARDPDDPTWFADPGLASGTMTDRDGAVGPLLVVDDATVDRLAERPLVRWTVAPRLDDTSPGALRVVSDALGALPGALRDAGVLVQGATVDDDATGRLAALAAEASAARDLGEPATVLVAAAGLLALLAAAGAVAARTAAERAVLAARGGAARALVRREVPAVLAGCAVGAVGAFAVAGMVARAAGGLGTAGTAWPVAVAVLGGAAALVLAAGTRPVGGRTTLVGRWPSRGASAAAGLLAVLGGVATWVATRPAGSAATGPLDGAAPAAAALVLVLAGGLVVVVARAARPGLAPGLVAVGAGASLVAGAAALALAADAGSVGRATWLAAAPAAAAGLAVVVLAEVVTSRWDAGRLAPHARRRAGATAPALVVALLVVVAAGWLLGGALADVVLGVAAR